MESQRDATDMDHEHCASPVWTRVLQEHGNDNPLAVYYSDFGVQDRILLTGHSHQAWPNCARAGMMRAYEDAALHVDDKWDKAQQVAKRVQRGYAKRLDDPSGEYALGQNVHELFVRWLSSLPAYANAANLAKKAPILSSDEEFHALRRQFQRIEEYGIQVQRVSMKRGGEGNDIVCRRLIEALHAQPRGHFAAVVVSAVSFMQGLVIRGLDELAKVCRDKETPLLLDAYHAVNVLPFSVQDLQLDDVFIVGGGYKYCQLGEGVCFLRVPKHHVARPAITGWFAEFAELDRKKDVSPRVHNAVFSQASADLGSQPAVYVDYANGAPAFAGSTYDPTSHYRAAAVFDFFEEQGLGVAELRKISQRQISRLARKITELTADPKVLRLALEVPDHERAGFLALHCPGAGQWVKWLRAQGLYCDARADVLRLGPAPYVSDAQLDAAVQALGECAYTFG